MYLFFPDNRQSRRRAITRGGHLPGAGGGRRPPDRGPVVTPTTDRPVTGHPATEQPERGADVRRRLRTKNLVVMAVLIAFVVLVYLVSLVRMGGG